MKEQDLLEEIGKVSEELIAAHALPDAKRYGEGGAEQSVTAKEQIVMSEKKNEYIKNPFIRALPAIAAAAAVLVAGVIILPKTGLMRTPATSVDSEVETSEITETSDFRLKISKAWMNVIPGAELEHSGNLDVTAELEYAGQDAAPTVWYGGFTLEKNGKLLYENVADSVQPEHFENPAAEPAENGAVIYDKEPEPLPVAYSAQGAVPLSILAPDLDAHWIQNEPGDLMLTVYCRVGSPAAEPITVTAPVTDYEVRDFEPTVALPDLNNWTYNDAKQQIESAGLFVDKRSAYSDEIPEGHVISTDPELPAELAPGTYVRVIVSLGSGHNIIPVPNFIGMNWELAETMADGMGLTLTKNAVPSSEPEGTVLAQSIEVGTEVAEDTVIDLEVSTGSEQSEFQIRTFRIPFQIPTGVTGQFHIELYKDGECVETGSSFDPEYAAGTTSVAVTVENVADVIAYLVNDRTGAKAEIGICHLDAWDGNFSFDKEINIEEVFRQVTETGTSSADQ